MLKAVKEGRFDRKRLSAFQVRQMRSLNDAALDKLLDETWGEIKTRQKLAQSLMPPGLLEALPERKVIELLKFLTSKG